MLATRSISQLICYKCNKINQPIYWSDITAVAYNKAIYILQAIDVNHQKYNNFYDTRCRNMVSRYFAIKCVQL